ncbi:LysR family transcriptional regulator [Mesorhizobium sp. CU2]|uniref:LysR family transcriptional regulator n=1 Tax=unclassified Mesorhizobium TaxID=325217 RepID=UPI0011295479|nr:MULTISPECIES: LysR family transcriptional regulator [unclassified Mesorhizobium]TPN85648.1 LysR family transcriptional regulator [Mesorhizobium sp. CU3]TPO11005.1 LysR family transcriptional regulator [Mesorhizobium sp. CU2]
MMGRTLNLNRLEIFVAVVETGSITAAARRLGLVKTAVSTHLQKLEREVGAALLIRTTRQLRLTEAGRTFFEACRPILRDIDSAVAEIDESATNVRGTLRVTTSEEFGAMVVAPIAAALVQQYPALRIDLIASDRIIDISAENIDVAIRLGWLRESSQQSIRIGSFEQWVLVSTSQAEWASSLTIPEELRQRKLFALSALPNPTNWVFSSPAGEDRHVKFDARLTATTTSVLKVAALNAEDLVILPDYAVREEIAAGRLMRVLPQWTLPKGEIHAVFPPSRYRPLKVRIFLNALKTASQGMPEFGAG